MRRALVLLVWTSAIASADPKPKPVAIGHADATRLLYGGGPPPAACQGDADPVACLIDARYAKDHKAGVLARALFRDTGSIAGVGEAELMDGGFRGKIKLVPELPIGRHRKHLAWLVSAMNRIDSFFGDQLADTAPSYRWRGIGFRFVRSVGKRTPSAYAIGWAITYNVSGSLLTSEGGVRETVFHELFHLNDFDHGDWSATALAKDYAAIVKRCGTKSSCLAPFAPNRTKVRATGTYYAFQPNNGDAVHEYAAELAVRYYREQTEMRERKKLTHKAFKCGAPENARAWQALVDEFFSGRDLVPAC